MSVNQVRLLENLTQKIEEGAGNNARGPHEESPIPSKPFGRFDGEDPF